MLCYLQSGQEQRSSKSEEGQETRGKGLMSKFMSKLFGDTAYGLFMPFRVPKSLKVMVILSLLTMW